MIDLNTTEEGDFSATLREPEDTQNIGGFSIFGGRISLPAPYSAGEGSLGWV